MELRFSSTDDSGCVWQPREEPAASTARPQDDAGGSRRAQRCSRHRGQPHRERQARPPGLHGAEVGRSRWPQHKRSAALSIRPASCRFPAAGGRPFSRQAYFVFNVCRSGTTGPTGAIFIPCSPPPARQPPTGCRGGKARVRIFLMLSVYLTLIALATRLRAYAQTLLKSINRPNRRSECV